MQAQSPGQKIFTEKKWQAIQHSCQNIPWTESSLAGYGQKQKESDMTERLGIQINVRALSTFKTG